MKNVLIWLFADERVCQFIDIMVVDIPEAYGLILSRDSLEKLNGYFATDWPHLWFPYKNCQNHIKVLREPHMKHNVTQLEGKNEPMYFSYSILGKYFIELEPGNYQAEEASSESDKQSDLLQFSRTDKIDCNIVNLVSSLESNTSRVELEDKFCFLYFDGSKTQDVSGAGCVLIDLEKNNIFSVID